MATEDDGLISILKREGFQFVKEGQAYLDGRIVQVIETGQHEPCCPDGEHGPCGCPNGSMAIYVMRAIPQEKLDDIQKRPCYLQPKHEVIVITGDQVQQQ